MTPERRIWLGAGLASLLLSLLAVWQNPYINTDGVHYLRAVAGDTESVRHIGHWLFYSKLIGLTSQITGLELETAAQLLNALLDLTTVLALLMWVKSLGGDHRVLFWAALLVLSLPYFNGNRAEIIRDHGYWAFSLLALTAYTRLWRRFSWRALAGWNLAMILATAFRVEGVAFLVLMPLGLLARPLPWRRRLLQSLAALGPALLLLLLWLIWGPEEDRLSRLLQQGSGLFDSVLGHFEAKAQALHELLPDFSIGSSRMVLLMALLLAIARDLAESLSWPLALLLLARRWFPAPGVGICYRQVVGLYAAITLLVLLLHGSRHFIMVSRYTLALALALLPLAAFSLAHFWSRREGSGPRRLVVILALGWLVGDSLIDQNRPKPYLTDAGRWAAAHLAPGTRVVTDYDPLRLSYYAERAGGRHLQFERYGGADASLNAYGYAFIRDPDGPLARALMEKPHALVWRQAKGGREVLIYRLEIP